MGGTEGLFALSCGSRAEVDDLVKKALAAGGTHAMDPRDQGFMYIRSFYDLDGHHWLVAAPCAKSGPFVTTLIALTRITRGVEPGASAP